MTVPYTAVQFMALQAAKGAAAAAGWEDTPTRAQASAFATGAAAGTAATVASYPFDLLRTTLAPQGEPRVYHGMLDAAKGLISRAGGGFKGAQALYTGLGVTLVEIIPYAALQFGLYDALTRAAAARSAASSAPVASPSSSSPRRAHRRVALRGGRSSEPPPTKAPPPTDPATRFVCGLLAGTAAKLATHPLDVVKKRYQVAGLERAARYGARVPAAMKGAPLRAALTSLATVEGLRGCYKGALPSLLKAAPQAAVTLTAFEWAAGWLAGVGL
jgi:solute carrier family 25 thiamine pyrophosphate transporter 19